jgi:hypothetical protein
MSDEMKEKWIVGQPGGPSGPFYSIVSSTGQVIAMRVITEKLAKRIAQIPELESSLETWYLRCKAVVKENDRLAAENANLRLMKQNERNTPQPNQRTQGQRTRNGD